MPEYEFRCEECGPFVQWISMKSITETIICPTCENEANRIYSPPGVILTSCTLRRRVKQSVIPKVVQREKANGQHYGHRHRTNRPWMVGH
ncbi:FmdB family zinc ribbon protein [Paenactinomyces guangxiensis]|uniref:Zinc ribbon domain-containing protein n=1 Tax=Paenactinomyces guangxiensis TaxID=1490290 RepID=A0A7W1WPB2_9BACL|nr:zinc ribbon domain-containing protein [Paenactinomyces guangxiensis]MBH8590527.1 zinc ribbon domain-containing protein [Paenactinomyces guangxiensis]